MILRGVFWRLARFSALTPRSAYSRCKLWHRRLSSAGSRSSVASLPSSSRHQSRISPALSPRPIDAPSPARERRGERGRGEWHDLRATPKSHNSRSVPYPAFLSDLLAKECEGKTRDDLLFGSGESHVRRSDNRTEWWMKAVAAAEAADPAFDRVTVHDLRHTAASLAISAGATVKAVQRMLGHASTR